jgi:hypothetical protein
MAVEELKVMGKAVPGVAVASTGAADAATAGAPQQRSTGKEQQIEAWLEMAGLPPEPEVEPVGILLVEYTYELGAVFAILGFTYMILCFVTRTNIDQYEQEQKNITAAISDSLDTARSGVSLCIIFSVVLMIMGFLVILYKYKMKNAYIRGKEVFAFDPQGSGGTWILILFMVLNLAIMITFATTTVAQPWFNKLQNTSSYVLMATSVISTLLSVIYVGYRIMQATNLRKKFQYTRALVEKAITSVNAMNIANNFAKSGAYTPAELEKINRTAMEAVNDANRAATGMGATNLPKADANASTAKQMQVITRNLQFTQQAVATAQTPQSSVKQQQNIPPAAKEPSERSREAARYRQELERAQKEKKEMESLLESMINDTETAPSAPPEQGEKDELKAKPN